MEARKSMLVPVGARFRMALVLAVVVLMPLVGIAASTRGITGFVAFLAFVGLGVVSLLPLFVYRSTWGFFHPLVFFALWWCLVQSLMPQIGTVAFGLESHGAMPGMPSSDLDFIIAHAILLETIFVVSIVAGFKLTPHAAGLKVTLGPPRSIIPKMAVVAVLSVAALMLLVYAAGGIEPLLLQRGVRSDQRVRAEIGAHLHYVVGVLKFCSVLWASLEPRMFRSVGFWLVFSFALLASFLATGSRGDIVFPALMLLIVWALHRNALPTWRILLAGALALGAVGVLGEVRTQSRGAERLSDIRVQQSFGAALHGGLLNFVRYRNELNGLYGIVGRVPSEVGYLFGESYAAAPAAPIPRALWQGKPQAIGQITSERIFDNPFGGVPAGNVGEAFWNFSYPGVVLVGLFWGFVLRGMEKTLQCSHSTPGITALLAITLLVLQPNSLNFIKWMQAVIPTIAVWIWICGVPRVSIVRSTSKR